MYSGVLTETILTGNSNKNKPEQTVIINN